MLFSIRTDSIEPVGMLSEGAIIDNANSFEKDIDVSEDLEKSEENNESNKVSFTYQDEGSIGNTSDNLEAISEGASNHSVASSLEMENEDQNDNYSDMLSANVSGKQQKQFSMWKWVTANISINCVCLLGRGTPNISGRDTPSSQVNENDDRASSEIRQADNAQLQQQSQLSRQIRSEIDDKFCKFEIKLPGPGRDETTSLISETWSTDVLASDNEAVDANDSRTEQQCCSLIDQPIVEVPMSKYHMIIWMNENFMMNKLNLIDLDSST